MGPLLFVHTNTISVLNFVLFLHPCLTVLFLLLVLETHTCTYAHNDYCSLCNNLKFLEKKRRKCKYVHITGNDLFIKCANQAVCTICILVNLTGNMQSTVFCVLHLCVRKALVLMCPLGVCFRHLFVILHVQ